MDTYDKVIHVSDFQKHIKPLLDVIRQIEVCPDPSDKTQNLTLGALMSDPGRPLENKHLIVAFRNFLSADIKEYIALKMLSQHESRFEVTPIPIENQLSRLFTAHNLPEPEKLAEKIAANIEEIVDKAPEIQPATDKKVHPRVNPTSGSQRSA